jgi:hypothetical protein
MNAALRDFQVIWRAAVARREPGAMRTLYLVAGALGMCVLIPAVLGGKLQATQVLRIFVAVAAALLTLAWSFVFVPGSIRLNSPINAWLLPQQRRRLLQMAAAYWLVATPAIAFGIGAWDVLPLVALGTLGLPLLGAGNRVVPWLLIVGGNWIWLARVVLPPAWADFATGNAAMAVLGALVLPAAVWGLRWLYPAGGDAYLDRRDEQARLAGAAGNCDDGRQPLSAGMAGQQGNVSFYLSAMRRELRRADPGAMLMHALGPAVHWTAWIAGVLGLAALGVTVRLLTWRYGTSMQAFVDWMSNIAPTMLALSVAFSTAQYGQQLRRTRGEQALLRLTPLAGDTTLLNRRLATRMLRQALSIWVLQSLAVLCVTLPFSPGPDALLRQVGLCSLAGQVALMGLLDDYASDQGGWNLAKGFRAAGLAAAQALAAVGLGALTGTSAWPWLVVMPLVVCCVLLRRDWRRMLAAPPAFPAARMA